MLLFLFFSSMCTFKTTDFLNYFPKAVLAVFWWPHTCFVLVFHCFLHFLYCFHGSTSSPLFLPLSLTCFFCLFPSSSVFFLFFFFLGGGRRRLYSSFPLYHFNFSFRLSRVPIYSRTPCTPLFLFAMLLKSKRDKDFNLTNQPKTQHCSVYQTLNANMKNYMTKVE